jgi:nicotinamide riboside transporter PnuC
MNNKIEWVGCIGGVIGAFLVASNTTISGFGFIPFLIGAIAYMIVAYQTMNPRLFLLNAVFASANIIGIYRWLF